MNTQCYFKADEESWDEIPVWMDSQGHDRFVDEIDWKKDGGKE
jgi:hypothetical protein